MKWPHWVCGNAATPPTDRRGHPWATVAVWLLLAIVAAVRSSPRCAADETGAVTPAAAFTPRVPPPVPLSRQPSAVPTSSAAAGRDASSWQVVGIVAAAFAAVVAVRLLGRRRDAALPADVFEVLGSGSLGGQHSVRVVRFGPKTLLVSLSATGCHTLSELDDPQATDCIAAACRGVHPPLRPSRGIRGAPGLSAPVPPASRATAARVTGQEVA